MVRTIVLGIIALFTLPLSAIASPSAETVGPDVEPELPMSVYKARRDHLMSRLGMCAAAIKSAPDSKLGLDPYFFYLTGIDDRGAVLFLSPKDSIVKQSLHFRPIDPEAEVWTGYREPMSVSLRKKYQVDEVRRIRGGALRGLSKGLRRSRCYAQLRSAMSTNNAVSKDTLGKLLKSYSARTVQKWEQLEAMRAVKDDEEIKRIEKAIAITGKGHEAAIVALVPGITERRVVSKIEAAFYRWGATGLAFPSIVGSGENGAVLHWEKNSRVVTKDDLVVVDIGASYGGYASDITRTYPVSGTFSPEQRKVYEAVLAAQNKVIAAVKPGVSLDRLHRIGEEAITAAGYELPHYIGHFVGLQVHDVGDTGAGLEAGMVITVEPGIYIRGKLGVRIEDMVLVTAKGSKLLTKALPREVAEVEKWMKSARDTAK